MNASPQAIKTRLLAMTKRVGHPYNFVFERFTQERLLYRLSTGKHADHFTLKGGLYLTAITDAFSRATHDIDFEASGDNDPVKVREMVAEGIAHGVPPDGLNFDEAAIVSSILRERADYPGVRLRIPGTFGRQEFSVQIDLGFGDRILLPIAGFCYPSLIESLPGAIVRAYSKESVVAEKFEAMVSLGRINSRYKDFDDVAALADRFQFYAASLNLACTLTFEERGTNLRDLPDALDTQNADGERERHWRAYVRREHARTANQTFSDCLTKLRSFASGVFAFNRDGMDRVWLPELYSWQIVETQA